MYQRYFGFKERPFRLVPDPAYLFMGGSHREAMAHLSYAVGSGDGFAMVIGEVGTGKTTLCRSFLERLEATVTSAYIFNPPADPVDLIRAVNRDFDLPVATDNLQDLVEDLNRFLIREKTAGRTVILVIDEAQRLSRQVLEQIRLLSNLETTRSKLLLIVLVGQPELQATLADPGLRQLRQRITARCRLAPLTLAETGAYIRHRLTVAADGPPVAFTPGAIRALFGFSGGIPRLINMACDRALLVAYAASDRLISRTVAVDAVRELSQDAPARRPVFGVRGLQTLVLAGVLVLALVVLGLDMAAPPQGDAPILPVVARRPGPKTPKVQPPPRTSVESALPRMWLMDRSKALDTVLSLWGCSAEPLDEAPDDDLAFFRRRVAPTGLAVYRIDDRPDLVDRLNLPALLVINDANGSGYAVLAALKDGQYLLRDGTAAETRAHPFRAGC